MEKILLSCVAVFSFYVIAGDFPDFNDPDEMNFPGPKNGNPVPENDDNAASDFSNDDENQTW